MIDEIERVSVARRYARETTCRGCHGCADIRQGVVRMNHEWGCPVEIRKQMVLATCRAQWVYRAMRGVLCA